MKKIIYILVGLIWITTLSSKGQEVQKDYVDGLVYLKIKNNTPFTFDTISSNIVIQEKLSFLNPLVKKYNITKAEASFYFSRSEILKRTFRISFSNVRMVDQFVSELEKLSQVEYAEKIPLVQTTFTPNDLGSNLLGTQGGQYSLYNIEAEDAWDIAIGVESVEIAIVDNAIDISHSDLPVSGAWDVSDNDGDPSPPTSAFTHGTHTSGIACAKTNNGVGIASIGYGCTLIAIKATRNTSAATSIDNGYEGIAWAATSGAKIISCSWASPISSITGQNTINDAYNNDAVVVASAGNNNQIALYYPAAYNHVLSVANIDNFYQKASTSNYGTWIDISAPGENIRSTLPGNTYGVMGGTSMSAPLVAGLCGLIRSINPGLNCDDVVSIILNTADNIDLVNPNYIGKLGSGVINAFEAVKSALPCNGYINLGSGIYTGVKTESSSTIESANKIGINTRVTFDATTSIILQPGFLANNTCTFHAYIDGCGNLRTAGNNNQPNKMRENVIAKEMGQNDLMCYPNPFSDNLTIQFNLSKDDNATIKLFDIMGKEIKTISNSFLTEGKHDISMDASDIPPGIYFVVLQSGNSRMQQKIIKMN